MKITDTLNVKIQERFIYWGVHDILDADDTAALTEEIIALFTHLIEEEAKGMGKLTTGFSIDQKHFVNPKDYVKNKEAFAYNQALSDLSTRLIEAVKGK